MNIVVLQENFVSSLAKTGKFLPSKTSSIGAVNNFLLSAKDDAILITATDLETTITTTIPGKIITSGEVILPAKTALSLVSLFKGEKLTLFLDQNTIKIKGESTEISLKTISPESYPKEEVNEKSEEIRFLLKDIKKIVSLVGFSVSTDQARPILGGVFFSVSNKTITAVSTDGFRLSVLQAKNTATSWEGSIIFPLKAIRAFTENAKEDKNITMNIYKKNKKVAVISKGERITTRLIDGSFPDYQKIIPQGAQTAVSIEKQEFVRAVKISSIFARESSSIIKVSVVGQNLAISANSPQTGENKTTLSVIKEGEDIEMAFNYRFLLDLLTAAGEEETIILETNGPLQPCVFHFGKKQEFFHIIMPVRLQESK